MRYQKMTARGPEASILGFGCMRLPTIGGNEGNINEPEATRLLHTAIERGINYVDTAYPYHQGHSEPWLGRALAGGYREKILLATKLPSWAIQTRADCDRYLNEQLTRLQTSQIDFYLLHCLKRDWWENLKRADVFSFLDAALKDGRIRHAGFSFHDDYPLFEEVVQAYDWTFCQIQLNYMDEAVQAGVKGLKFAARRGLAVVAMEPLRGGSLVKPLPADIQSLWDGAPVRRPLVEWAFRWVWNHPEVNVLLTSVNEPRQLEENLALAAQAQPNSLTAEELALIAQVRARLSGRGPVPCTVCGYCQPCPQGVAIPRILNFYNDRYIYEDRRGPSTAYQVLLSPEQQATRCNECGECEEACPQQIPIREMLKKSHQELGG